MGDTEPYPRDLGTQHATVPLPRDGSAPGTRARRRWPWIVAAAVVVLAALVVVAEFVARAVVADVARTQVITALHLPEDQQIDVATDGIVLAQLLAGRLDALHLSSDDVAVGPFAGAVTAEARGFPLHGGPMTGATGTIRVTAEQLGDLVGSATDLPVDEIALEGANVTAKGALSLFGQSLPIALTLKPDAVEGDIALTAVSASVAGVTLDAAQLAGRFGGLADGLTAPQRICIADQIPAGLHLVSLAVTDGQLVAGLRADGAITSDASLQRNGTCPSR
ncbi:DUF2993 domain-containing protein [Microbacterium resistens]|uniref:DUF2993 domain-containing protein n=1 Tax=Microbacterium resistens TaxID=156977 RepID=A0ABY3RY55_9MICO|nr:LmeA family phospholipid-binding protein [Microbacterium resistens]UGS27980.1 DUF2993 domain-containing protein [Microbacterium resistens]